MNEKSSLWKERVQLIESLKKILETEPLLRKSEQEAFNLLEIQKLST